MSDLAVPARRRALNPWLLAPLAVFAGLAAMFVAMLGKDPSLVPSPLIGKAVPAMTLPALPGLTRGGGAVPGLTDADLRAPGGALLNVFASWCVPCREEQPVLMDIAAGGATVLGLDYKDEPENARRFLGSLGEPYAKVGIDPSGRAALDLGVYGVPETFAIDATGRIVAKHVGALTPEAAKALLAEAAGRAP
jgi:cytochrome c biogenesis protein CcmG/thiol:disulfide interchange protein DsbE